ncbi:unnamed protein product [Urochloa decumbens]|uniref:Uncharacterized protein n=1 Tax=Urochloa decumbens TaxID=240449 RepID=A0ABC9GAU7_9POAL
MSVAGGDGGSVASDGNQHVPEQNANVGAQNLDAPELNQQPPNQNLDMVPVVNPSPVQVELALDDNEVLLALNLMFHIPSSVSISPFNHLTSLIIDLDTIVPSYVADANVRLYLASISYDQVQLPATRVVIGPSLPPGGLVPYPDSDDDEEVKEVEGPISSSRKRRRRRLREPLESSFVRRSLRLNPDVGGFRDAESQAEATAYPNVYSAAPVDATVVAPHLSMENIKGIATGFLQIQPEAVSPALLLELDDDDAE